MAKKKAPKPPVVSEEDDIQKFVDSGKSDYQLQREKEIADFKDSFEEEILISGASFHNFNDMPEFVGSYTGREVKAEKDDGDRKKGDVMGYVFATPDGEEALIGNAYSVAKAIAQIKPGTMLKIYFKGKKQAKAGGGRTFNQFDIRVLTPKKK